MARFSFSKRSLELHSFMGSHGLAHGVVEEIRRMEITSDDSPFILMQLTSFEMDATV